MHTSSRGLAEVLLLLLGRHLAGELPALIDSTPAGVV